MKADVAVAAAGQLLEKLAALAVLMVLTRYVPAERLGDYFLAVSTAGLAGVLTSMGTTAALNRGVARDPEQAGQLLGRVLSVRLPLVVAAYGLIVGVTAVAAPRLVAVMALASGYTLLGNLWFSFSAVLLGLRRVRWQVVLALTAPALQVALVPLAAAWGWAFEHILLLLVGSNLLMLAVTLVVVRRCVGPAPVRWPTRLAWSFALGSWPFLAMTTLRAANFRIDTMMVYALGSAAEAAAYETAFKLLEVTQLMMRPVTMVFFPVCSAMVAQRLWPRLRRAMRGLVVLPLVLGAVVGLGVGVLAPWLMPMIWGESYAGREGVLRVLMISVPVLWTCLVASFLAASLGAEKRIAAGQAVALLVNVGMNAMIVPILGAVGAAWTTLATQGVLCVWLLGVVWRTFAASAAADDPAPSRPETDAAGATAIAESAAPRVNP